MNCGLEDLCYILNLLYKRVGFSLVDPGFSASRFVFARASICEVKIRLIDEGFRLNVLDYLNPNHPSEFSRNCRSIRVLIVALQDQINKFSLGMTGRSVDE